MTDQTAAPRPVPTQEERMRDAQLIGTQADIAFGTYLDRHERDQLDARAATAEQERDDALDDLRELRTEVQQWRATYGETALRDALAHHTELHTRLNATENDLRSQTRAVQELTAERDRARETTQRCWRIVKGTAAERNKLVDAIGRMISLPPEAIATAYEVGYSGTPGADAPSPSSVPPRRAQEEPLAEEATDVVLAAIRSAVRARSASAPPPRAQEDDLTDRLAGVVADVLSNFYEKGHPGEPCRRTGWVRERSLAAWRSVYAEWADRAEREG